MDVHTPSQRTFNMSRIRSKDTKPEIIVRRLCHSLGYRFRLHRKDLPGKPDLVFPKYKIALFVNGCFWHSHDCRWGTVEPKTRPEFWTKKRTRTVERDREVRLSLKRIGYRSCTIWECQTRDEDTLTNHITRLFRCSMRG
jgi:DNA mismatch endonuclease (patch repair protein)